MSKEKKATLNSNRLIHETSTYLLQHAYNPVDWYPWGSEALDKARKEEKPILLSVGYAACHWCHVMEHESFEDEKVAELMNKHFVNVKVDREERTDLDEIYMKAVQLMTGHGGWPMTVFLTPDLEPFFAGTYFPPAPRHGMPSFSNVIEGVSTAWKEKRADVVASASEITSHLKEMESLGRLAESSGQEGEHSADTLFDSMERLFGGFDSKWGGFGTAPKFPHTFSLMLAMRVMNRADTSETRRLASKELVDTTLDRMAFGGMHDQIGGGFARYSVDRQWLVPHFEKMLYDNALLCQTYLEGYQLTGRDYWRRVAEGILEFVTRELRTEGGAYFSSLDADSEGEEGKFYVWKPEQIKDVLGEEDGDWYCQVFGVTESGNFEHGTSVLFLSESPEEIAGKLDMKVEDLWKKIEPLSAKLLEQRGRRVRPGRDEKVLTSWNSLMISAFVSAYRVSGKTSYLGEAKETAGFLLSNLMDGDRLMRTWGQGKAKLKGYLDDYSYFIQALLDLASVDPDRRWFDTAVSLADDMLEQFTDEENGGFYFTSNDEEERLLRPKTHFDGSVPSATSVAVTCLLRLGMLTGSDKYTETAKKVFDLYGPLLGKAPDQFANLLCALDFHLSANREIALIVPDSTEFKETLMALNSGFQPYQVLLVAEENVAHEAQSPLLENRKCENGQPTVYVCENFTCSAPISDIEKLKSTLAD